MGKNGLIFGLGFGKTDDALTVFELTALAEEFNAFKTFQDTATCGDAAFAFQTWMLAHKLKKSAYTGGRI